MSIEAYIDNMKMIQKTLLEFLEDESSTEEKYKNFVKIIADQRKTEDPNEFKLLLRLINNISCYHQRLQGFIEKIEKLLNNKLILLFLIQEKIIKVDEYIVSKCTSGNLFDIKKYAYYFSPEFSPFLTEEFIKKRTNDDGFNEYIERIKKEVPKDFYDKRKKGENDNRICQLIRLNNVTEFCIYVNEQHYPLQSYVPQSIYETNDYLLCNRATIIEYAAFYGSIDIIKYIQLTENIKFDSNIWGYAIHSNNAELIEYLEDNNVSIPDYDEIFLCLLIQCHHIEISSYFIDNVLHEIGIRNDDIYKFSFQCDNYFYFPEEIDPKYFPSLSYSGCYSLVKLLLQQGNFNINIMEIKPL